MDFAMACNGLPRLFKYLELVVFIIQTNVIVVTHKNRSNKYWIFPYDSTGIDFNNKMNPMTTLWLQSHSNRCSVDTAISKRSIRSIAVGLLVIGPDRYDWTIICDALLRKNIGIAFS